MSDKNDLNNKIIRASKEKNTYSLVELYAEATESSADSDAIPDAGQRTDVFDQHVPSWIKSNAGWWATDQIDDSSFLQGIQYLVQKGIIVV